MEARIKSMESAIIASGLRGTADLGAKEEDESFDKIEIQARLSNQISNLVIDSKGSPNFIGKESAFNDTNRHFRLRPLLRPSVWIFAFFSTRVSMDFK